MSHSLDHNEEHPTTELAPIQQHEQHEQQEQHDQQQEQQITSLIQNESSIITTNQTIETTRVNIINNDQNVSDMNEQQPIQEEIHNDNLTNNDINTNNDEQSSLTATTPTKPTEEQFKFPLTISYRNCDIIVKVPARHNPLPNISTPIIHLFEKILSLCTKKPSTKDFYRVKNISGCIEPGQMTLVVSPSGHGKTSYLKLLSTMLSLTNGVITYNGIPLHELSKQNVDPRKLLYYQEQVDLHLPLLNVYETIEFASKMGSIHGDNEQRINNIIDALGLTECKATLIGDALIRGISGGQKRRVTTGICLASDAPVIFLDQYSDGLDSAVTYKITQYLQNWVQTTQSSVVATLQSPTPEVFNLFDHIILLREGEVIYDGPRCDTLPFLEAMGFKCRDDVDACDFILDVLQNPRQTLQLLRISELKEKQLALKKEEKESKNKQKKNKMTTTTSTSSTPKQVPKKQIFGQRPTLSTSLGQLQFSQTPCLTTTEMVEFYETTIFWQELNNKISKDIPINDTTNTNTNTNTNNNNSNDITTTTQLTTHPQPNNDDDDNNTNNSSHNTNPSSKPTYTFPHSNHTLLTTPEEKKRYSSGFRIPLLQTLQFAFARQIKIGSRSRSLLFSRCIVSIVMGFIYAALYYQIPRDEPIFRIASILLSMSQSIYNNMQLLSSINAEKKIINREIDSSLYPPVSYVISSFVTQIPLMIIEPFGFTMLFYFMEGLYIGFEQIMVYWCLMILVSFASYIWFSSCAILMPDMPRSLIVASPTVSILTTFAGFYIAYKDIKNWLIWLYWFSPFSWLVRAFALNEFKSPRYDSIIINAITGEQDRMGDAYLMYASIFTNKLWILWCAIYIICFCIIFMGIQSLLLLRRPPEATIGTRRVKDVGDDEQIDLNTLTAEFNHDNEQNELEKQRLHNLNNIILHNQQEYVEKQVQQQHSHNTTSRHNNNTTTHTSRTATTTRHNNNNDNGDDDNDNNNHHEISLQHNVISTNSSSHLSRTKMSSIIKSQLGGNNNINLPLRTLTEELPFYPTSIAFADISYTIKVKNLQGEQYERKLLDKINGYVQPGDLCCLLGSSGAGKTTLLDVLAGLKNQGIIEGKCLFNGLEVDKSTRGVLTGYVHQFPSLWGFSSVEETLLFAARLRMGTISEELKYKVVEEILDVLDLTPIRHYIIGNMYVQGLSPSQLKRVSIGVELVSNPSIIFLDEPTTGLDSSSSMTVLRAINRIARSGRTIIATLHSPSAEMFYFFNKLYLLCPGGHQVYGGDVGYRTRSFIKYFSSIPGIEHIQPRSNPANWMLTESSKIPHVEYVSYSTIKTNTTLLDDYNIDQDGWEQLTLQQQWILYLKWYYFNTAHAWVKTVKDLNIVEDIYYTRNPHEIRQKRYISPQLLQQLNKTIAKDDDIQKQIIQKVENHDQTQQQNQSQIQEVEHNSNKNNDIEITSLTTRQDNDKNNNSTNDENKNDNGINVDILNQELRPPDHPSIFRQFILLFRRHFTLYYRNPSVMVNRVLVLIFVSIITGLIYLQFQVTDSSSTISYMASIIMAMGTFCFNISNASVPIYIYHRSVQYRERTQGYLSLPWLWSLAAICNEIVWSIPLVCIASIPVWFMIGFPTIPVSLFFQYLLALYTIMITFISAQQFFSTIVPNLGFSQICTSLLTGLAFSLNGIGISYSQLRRISIFHQVLYWILPLGPLNLFLSDSIFSTQSTKYVDIINPETNILESTNLYLFAQSYFGFNPNLRWFYYSIIVIQLFVWQLLYQFATQFIMHNKR